MIKNLRLFVCLLVVGAGVDGAYGLCPSVTSIK